MHLGGALLGWGQHSQAQQEELGEHQRSPSIYPQGLVWGHCSKREGNRMGVQGSSHGNSLCCSSSVPPIHAVQAMASIWRCLGTQRERDREGCWRFYASAPQVSVCCACGGSGLRFNNSLLGTQDAATALSWDSWNTAEGNHLHCVQSLCGCVGCMHAGPHVSSCVMG